MALSLLIEQVNAKVQHHLLTIQPQGDTDHLVFPRLFSVYQQAFEKVKDSGGAAELRVGLAAIIRLRTQTRAGYSLWALRVVGHTYILKEIETVLFQMYTLASPPEQHAIQLELAELITMQHYVTHTPSLSLARQYARRHRPYLTPVHGVPTSLSWSNLVAYRVALMAYEDLSPLEYELKRTGLE